MNKKTFIVVLFVLVLFSINFSVAQELDNFTCDNLNSTLDDNVLQLDNSEDAPLEASKANIQLNVVSTTNFDAVGEYFKVKLSDASGNVITNTKVTFTVSGKNYNQNTDSNGIASLQLRLNDGSYQITTKFAGNSNYQASSITTTVTMSNTRVVDAGLSNSEIQKIIDNAKVNNVILS